MDTIAYAQWVIIDIVNASSQPIKIKDVVLYWGKFHKDGDKDNEVPTSDIDGEVILAGESYRINTCGRVHAASASGTEGFFDLVDLKSNIVIRNLYWNCPLGGPKANTWQVIGRNSAWFTESSGANLYSNALGTIAVTAVRVK